MKTIAVIGSINIDTVINVEHIPVVGETISANKVDIIPGGKGANQAYTIGKLGGNVTMLSAVGNDTYGKIVLESLASANVDVSHIKSIDNISTGNAIITVNKDGDNSITIISGANSLIDTNYIDEQIEVIKQSDIIVMQLEIPVETVKYVAKKAKEFGKMVILDPAPAVSGLSKEFLSMIDIIKPNETELRILLNNKTADKELSKSADVLIDLGVSYVLITLGGDGVYLKNCNKEYKFNSFKVPVIDTTAAGDSFTGAIAYSLSIGKDIVSATEFANKVASLTVTKKGAQPSIPSLDEVESFFK